MCKHYEQRTKCFKRRKEKVKFNRFIFKKFRRVQMEVLDWEIEVAKEVWNTYLNG